MDRPEHAQDAPKDAPIDPRPINIDIDLKPAAIGLGVIVALILIVIGGAVAALHHHGRAHAMPNPCKPAGSLPRGDKGERLQAMS